LNIGKRQAYRKPPDVKHGFAKKSVLEDGDRKSEVIKSNNEIDSTPGPTTAELADDKARNSCAERRLKKRDRRRVRLTDELSSLKLMRVHRIRMRNQKELKI